jgi:hypothetical protein
MNTPDIYRHFDAVSFPSLKTAMMNPIIAIPVCPKKEAVFVKTASI